LFVESLLHPTYRGGDFLQTNRQRRQDQHQCKGGGPGTLIQIN